MAVNKQKNNLIDQESKVQKALARSALYQFLSLCFFEPKERFFPILKSDEYLGNIRESLDDYLSLNSFNGRTSVMKGNLGLLRRHLKEKSFEELSSEYMDVWGSFTAAKECPMYETLYGNEDISQLTQSLQTLADIGGFYRAFGLQLSENVKERYDHLGMELEFMHVLTYKEAYALENHGDEQLKTCADAEKKFLKSHLARWVPLFTMLVNKRANNTVEFYPRLAADLLSDFVSLETKLLKIRVEEATELNVEAMKEDDFQCGAGACKLESDSKIPS